MGTGRSARSAVLGLLTAALAACGGAQGGDDRPLEPGPPVLLTPAPDEPDPVPRPDEVPALPPVTEEMHALLEEVSARWVGHPDLGQSEVDPDRSLVILRWYGTPPAELAALAQTSAGAGFDVRLDATRFRATELSAEAGRLVQEHPGVVTGAGPRAPGDGIEVSIDPAVSANPDAQALEELGVVSRFPLFPGSMAPPVAASAVG